MDGPLVDAEFRLAIAKETQSNQHRTWRTFPLRDQSMKFDGDKPMLELVPPEAILAIGRVMTYGAQKYERHGWKQVEAERYVGALMRHLMAYLSGEEFDGESGLRHIEQVLCNAAFIVALESEARDA